MRLLVPWAAAQNVAAFEVGERRTDQHAERLLFAQVRIRGDARPDAVLIPNAAIVQRAGQSVAFVDVDGKAQQRVLTLGITDGSNTEVASGLDAGDQVITAGQDTLNDGDAVASRPAPRAERAAARHHRHDAPSPCNIKGGRTYPAPLLLPSGG